MNYSKNTIEIPSAKKRKGFYLIPIVIIFFLISCKENDKPKDVVDNYIPPPLSVVDKQFNFHIVDNNLWRSSQPNSESIKRMKLHGLKSIINLRGDEQTDIWKKKLSDSLGIKYFSKPMDATKEQDLDYLKEILSLIEDENNQPVLVHCLGGKDRTGLIVGMYKLKYSNISMEDLKKEIIMYGHDEKYKSIFQALKIWESEIR